MLRLFLYLALIAPLAWGAAWIADHPGEVQIDALGFRIEMSLGALLAFFALAVMVCLAVFFTVRFFVTLPSRLRHGNLQRRHAQGLEALTMAMSALAVADYSGADRFIKKARGALGPAPATSLLSAQLAHAKGQREEAREHLDVMLQSPQTRQVALHGMIEQSMRDKKPDQAIIYAKESWKLLPKDRWLSLVLINLHTRLRRWDDALEVIRKARSHGAITRADAHRYRGIIAFERARLAYELHTLDKALKLVRESVKLEPDFAPSQKLLVTILAERNEWKACIRSISHFWHTHPDGEYITILLDHFAHEPSARLLKRFERLAKTNPDHIESHLAMAECAIYLSQWERARESLRLALAMRESPRAYALLAEVERGEHRNESKANDWLQQAVGAPKDSAWHCTRCGYTHQQWQLHCPECESFDSFAWQHTTILSIEDVNRLLVNQ